MFHNIPPGVYLILGAILVPFLRGKIRNTYVMLLPVLAFYWVFTSQDAVQVISFMGFDLNPVRSDALSRAFGYIFSLNGFAAGLYAWHLSAKPRTDSKTDRYVSTVTPTHQIAALCYMGASIGVVFAGDLISLYIFWEIMAVASTFLILARRTKKAANASYRYILVHIAGGLLLLAGIIITIAKTGSITYSAEFFKDPTMGSWLILVGILVNAGAVPIGAWLPDAYPEATVTGGVILSAFTSKTAVYTLLRGFVGWDILIPIGCAMAVYGIIYALLENDMRRILAYSIINQVGFMVCAAGMGERGVGHEMAINGAVAHAFCHIIYKALLWMSAGAVLHMTLKSKCTDLGGLYKTMPLTMIFGTIGALAISAVPGTSGFTSKSMIIIAASDLHLTVPWFILEIASAGVFLHAGIKFPYFVFFAKDRGLRPGETNKSMLIAMAFLAFLCIFLGVYPQPLYSILPYQEALEGFNMLKLEKIIPQFQLLIFAALVFFLPPFLAMLKRTNTIVVDADVIYRKGGPKVYEICDKGLNGINQVTHQTIIENITTKVNHFFTKGPQRLYTMLYIIGRKLMGKEVTSRTWFEVYRHSLLNTFPIGATAFIAILLLAILFVL